MTRRSSLLLFAFTIGLMGAVGLAPAPASAHNSLVTSDPANGTTLTAAPSSITWTFKNSVPLETMSVFLTDATGSRTELSGSRNVPGNNKQVVTPLPQLSAGSISIRWRLVAPDGHTVSGRVALTVPAAGSTTGSTTASTAATTATTTATTAPELSSVPESVSTATTGPDPEDDGTPVPGAVRWILRYASYLAIMSVVGVLLVKALLRSTIDAHPAVLRTLGGTLIATAVIAALQLVVLASDIAGQQPWAALDELGTATSTDAGASYVVRIVLALTLWFVLTRCRFTVSEVYWTAVSVCGLGLLATWSFAGHARSMRWPQIGVVADVLHHGAAAVWLAGLVVVVLTVRRRTADHQTPHLVQRFSRVAAVSVAIIVATGVAQSVRLVGNPADLLDDSHGRALAIKIVLVLAMLALASANRRRLRDTVAVSERAGLAPLRRAVMAEVVLGLAVIAATSTMVVSAPASSAAPTETSSETVPPTQEMP